MTPGSEFPTKCIGSATSEEHVFVASPLALRFRKTLLDFNFPLAFLQLSFGFPLAFLELSFGFPLASLRLSCCVPFASPCPSFSFLLVFL